MRWISALLFGVALGVLRGPAPAAAQAPSHLYAVHGVILARLPDGRFIVRTDPVPLVAPGLTRTYRITSEETTLAPGMQIDGLISTLAPERLFHARAATRFVAGSPDALVTHVYDVGDRVADVPMIDQDGRLIQFSDFRGKTTLLSFVFTRCPDPTICPAISARFLYLQHHIDPAHFHLIEITLDPTYDSPPVLAKYGSAFDADPTRWSLVTGEPAEVKLLIDRFGIASISNQPGDFVHDDRLVIIDPHGRVASVIETLGWSPDDAIALARNAANLSSNPLRRWYVGQIANLVSLCGGGTSIANVLLDVAVFLIGVVVLGGATIWFGYKILGGKI